MTEPSKPVSARFSDGQTAGSRNVEVRHHRALEIGPFAAGVAEPDRWAYHRLTTSPPLSRSASDVVLRSEDHPGQSLFVSDPQFVAELRRRAPQLTHSAHRWRWARPGLALALLVLTVVGLVYLLDLSPARAIAGWLPEGIRTAIGEQAVKAFAEGHPTCSDAKGLAALERLSKRLSDAAEAERPFHLRVVDWDTVNAYALPGDQVMLLRGLIDQAISPDEVAGVLAHEMGHGIELHPEAGIIRAIGISAGLELFFTGSSGTLGNIGALLLQLRYSRDAEAEADAHALRILKGSGISPAGIADFFDRIDIGVRPVDGADTETSSGRDFDPLDLISTHPPSPERARQARAAATYPSTPALSAEDWASLRGICAVTEP